MTAVWNKIEELAQYITTQFELTGQPLEDDVSGYDWHTSLYQSARYRRAHLHTIDYKETHKIYILHVTVFPHHNDPSPIWGFDAVCGANKITGAFHDFSNAGDTDHYMLKWFSEESKKYGWSKPRELPEWARNIFSKDMVAAGNVHEGQELDDLCNLVKNSLAYYLKNVGNTQQDVADYHMAQNRYCHYQKQNPHVVRSMVNMGVEESKIRQFVNTIQYPETA
jgi:hypothetical protein